MLGRIENGENIDKRETGETSRTGVFIARPHVIVPQARKDGATLRTVT